MNMSLYQSELGQATYWRMALLLNWYAVACQLSALDITLALTLQLLVIFIVIIH